MLTNKFVKKYIEPRNSGAFLDPSFSKQKYCEISSSTSANNINVLKQYSHDFLSAFMYNNPCEKYL